MKHNHRKSKRKHNRHLKMAREFLKHLTKENEMKDSDQYLLDKMSATSLAQQAYYFQQSRKAKNLLETIEKK